MNTMKMNIKLHVTFYKGVYHGMFREKTLERVEFDHICNDSRNAFAEAYDEAVKRGHNPMKNIKIEAV